MATNLSQQKYALENRIKLLVNNDLKEICKANHLPVSGTKVVLQKRVMDVLQDTVSRNDHAAFDNLKHRISNHGQAPTHAPQPPAYPGSSSNSYSARPANTQATALTGRNLRHFKPSPFHELLETIVPLQDLAEMPQNRNTVRTQIVLSDEMARKLKSDSSLRILLFCGQMGAMNGALSADVAFPNQIEVKINGDEVRHNFKGLKNKPGTTKPADITRMVRPTAGYPTQLSLTYALTTRRFAFTACLAKYISPDKLIDKIKSAHVIAKQTVLDELNKANNDPDLAATSVRMSLKDPVSTMRIDLPVRSTVCKHIQCFDGAMFLQLQEQAPQWLCPICNKHIGFQYLCVDKYFEDILLKTSKSIEKVDVEPNGTWTVIKEEEDSQTNGTSHKPRASYDDDFDDDIVELIEVPGGTTNGNKKTSIPPDLMTGRAVNTPPESSRASSIAQSTASAQIRGSKRGSSAVVVDLTLSDDEDEPPRPAKRVATDGSMQGMRPYQSAGFTATVNPHSFAFGHTDNFRQAAMSTRAPSVSTSSMSRPSPFGTPLSATNTSFPSSFPRATVPPRPTSAAQPPPFSPRPPLPTQASSQAPPLPQSPIGYGLTLPPMRSQPHPQPRPQPQQHPQSQQPRPNGWADYRFSNSPP